MIVDQANTTPSADPTPPTPTPSVSTPPVDDEPIRNEAFLNKVLHEKKTATEKLKAAEAENKLLREGELKRQENFKQLAEQKDQELSALQTRFDAREEVIKNSSKKTAITKELKSLGCDDKYIDKALRFVDLKTIDYDESTGIITGQLEAARNVQEQVPVFFGTQTVGVNQGSPAGIPNNLTKDVYLAMSYEDRKKHKAEFYRQQGIERTR